MNKALLKEAAIAVLVLVTATLLIAVSNLDLTISSHYFIDGSWPIGNQFPWRLLYKLDRFPAISLALAGAIGFLTSVRCPDKRHWARPGAFLALLLVLGPGLLVNSYFKNDWGRPRPHEITQFSGEKAYLQPWQKGESGKGRSFPSGHSSAAFYMAAPYFIYRRSNRYRAYLWLGGGVGFGILMSIARITQGGHFLSDTLWAAGLVYLCALLLIGLLGIERHTPSSRTS